MKEKTLTIEDILCMLDEIDPGRGRRGYEALITTLIEGPHADLYHRIVQMATDAGTDRGTIGWEREAVTQHETVDHLLDLDTAAMAQELAAGIDMAITDHQALLRICAARRARGEGDAAKLAALEHELTLLSPTDSSQAVRRAQERLDLALGELVRAYTGEVGSKLASAQAAQHLLARALRELQTPGKSSSLAAAG